MGFYVTVGASVSLAGPETDFWPLAVQARSALWDCVERGDPFVYPLQHLDLSRVAAVWGLGPLGRRVYGRLAALANMGGLVFSNIGRVDIDNRQGPFVIENLGFAASGSCVSPLIATAATIDRRSTWNFVGMDPPLAPDHTRRIANLALEILTDAV